MNAAQSTAPNGRTQGTVLMATYRALSPRAHAELETRASLLTGTKHRDEARRLVEEGRVEPQDADGQRWEVVGRSSGHIYMIHRNTCPCRTKRDDTDPYACAHLAAIYLYKRVQEAMRKEGYPMFATDEAPQNTAPETRQDDPGATNSTQDDAEHVPGPKALLAAPQSPNAAQPSALEKETLDRQKHEIRRLLLLYGLTPKSAADYEDAVETHVGLSLVPAQFGAIITRLEAMIDARRDALPPPKLLKDYTVDIKGKSHIKYTGLLAYAHERGLRTLSAELTSVTPDLAIAKATAVFQDGRTFTEAGDATPDNVGVMMKPHYPRLALTRAKARALRDALNIDMMAAEEVE